MRVVQACPIDYPTDMQGRPYQKDRNLSPTKIAELQSQIDAGEFLIDAMYDEEYEPYNAILSCGTTRYLAELKPPPKFP